MYLCKSFMLYNLMLGLLNPTALVNLKRFFKWTLTPKPSEIWVHYRI